MIRSTVVCSWLCGVVAALLSLGFPAVTVHQATAADLQSPLPAGSAQSNPTTPEFDQMTERVIELVNDAGQLLALPTKIADEPQEQAAGFQFIAPEVIDQSLILFIFSEQRVTRFHMRNVRAPLDIAFIASGGAIIDIQRMQPDVTAAAPFGRTYGPDKPFQYALEARAGFFQARHISAGKSRLQSIPR
jgi:uncharacterized membrane protein (UPF0127 family)